MANRRSPCPKCGCRRTKVVLVRDAIDLQYDTIRRRRCLECDHRWWTGQKFETVIKSVVWAQRGQLVLEVHE